MVPPAGDPDPTGHVLFPSVSEGDLLQDGIGLEGYGMRMSS